MSKQNQSSGQTQNAPAKKPWYKKWWVIAIGVVIIIGIIGSSGEDKTDNQSAKEQGQEASQKVADSTEQKADNKKEEKPAEAEKLVPQVAVTSANIAEEYSENEVAADEKYKGKMIEISGKVVSVDNGTFDNEMIIKLSDGQYDISGPMCYMKESEKDKVLTFKKGQQVTLIGEGNSATIGSPMLKNCIVKQ